MDGLISTALSAGLTSVACVADTFNLRQCVELFNADGHQATALSDYDDLTDLAAFYIRRDRRDRGRLVNVFDQNGHKIYTIERKTKLSSVWSVYAFPSRREVATLRAGCVRRFVDFHDHLSGGRGGGRGRIQHRKLVKAWSRCGPIRRFYLHDGAPYEWTRFSQYLERVINPGGGDEEVRERVAKARLMRNFKLDYELVVNFNRVDPLVAITTGFISMLTQWGLAGGPDTRGPTKVVKLLTPGPEITLLRSIPRKEIATEEVLEVVDPRPVENSLATPVWSTQFITDQPATASTVPPQHIENRVFLTIERPAPHATEPHIELHDGDSRVTVVE